MADISYEDFIGCLYRDTRKDSDPELKEAATNAFVAIETYLRLGMAPPEKRWEVPA